MSIEKIKTLKCKDKIPFECEQCGKTFYKEKQYYQYKIVSLKKKNAIRYCGNSCRSATLFNGNLYKCGQCNSPIYRTPRAFKTSKSGKFFCNHSCSTKYQNAHKTYGGKRSKLEIYLEKELTNKYPLLKFDFNKNNEINSELDIFIPSLRFAVELNGPTHYEPIYSEEKLKRIKNNDGRKMQACLEKQIELCVIDTSQMKNFKEHKGKMILQIITAIIDNKLKSARTNDYLEI